MPPAPLVHLSVRSTDRAGYLSLLSGCSLDEMRSTGRALLVAAGVLILTNRLALVPRCAEC